MPLTTSDVGKSKILRVIKAPVRRATTGAVSEPVRRTDHECARFSAAACRAVGRMASDALSRNL